MSKWLKFYSGSLRDRRLTKISLQVNQPKAVVMGVWATLLSLANEHSNSGEILAGESAPLTLGEIIWVLEIDQGLAARILEGLVSLNLLEEKGDAFVIVEWNKYKAPPRDDYDEFRETIYERDKECVYCGNLPEHLDHIIPQTKGGSSTLNNIVAACARCNQSKNDSSLIDWYTRQPFFDRSRLAYVLQVLKG